MRGFVAIIVIVAALFESGCFQTGFKIADSYVICPEDEFGKGYYLICKLGCNEDPKIENIKMVEWNEKYIIIQNNSLLRNRWFIIQAQNDKLKCCNSDSIFSSLSDSAVKEFIIEKHIRNLETKIF